MKSPRLTREAGTLGKMYRLYCRQRHKENNLCNECYRGLEYALGRLSVCRFGEDKPVCSRCEVHCYAKSRREQTKKVMRYAGPRMIVFHPLDALNHLWDSHFRRRNAGNS